MKLSILCSKLSYEIKSLIQQAENLAITVQIFFFKDIKINTLRNNNISKLCKSDIIIARSGSLLNNNSNINIRNSLLNIYPEIEKKLLNGESYSRYQQFDKLLQTSILIKNKISIPKTYYQYNYQSLNFPLVMKGLYSNNGESIYLLESHQDYKKYSKKLGKGNYLIQELLPANGDYRIITLGNQVIGMMKKINELEFVNNLYAGGKAYEVEKAKKEELSILALKTAKAFNCEFSGVDIMYDQKNQPKVLEINRAPGYEGLEKLTKLNISKKILEYAKKNLN